MTFQDAPQWAPPQPAPKPRAKWLPATVTGVAGLVIGAIIGASAAGSSSHPTAAPTVTVTAPAPVVAAPTSTAPVSPVIPTAADFTIAVKIKSRACFGDAGCNVTYQIAPQYVGTLPLPSSTLEVTYQVSGMTSGPQINTFKLDPTGNATFQDSEFCETPSAATVLTAKITDVQAIG